MNPYSRPAFNPFPAAAMSNNMAKIAEARKTVEQLKLEVNIDRMKVLGRGGEEGGGSGARVWTGRGWRVGPGAAVGRSPAPQGWTRGGAGPDRGREPGQGRT